MLTRRFLPPRRFLGGGTKPKRSEALLYIEDSRQSMTQDNGGQMIQSFLFKVSRNNFSVDLCERTL